MSWWDEVLPGNERAVELEEAGEKTVEFQMWRWEFYEYLDCEIRIGSLGGPRGVLFLHPDWRLIGKIRDLDDPHFGTFGHGAGIFEFEDL